VVQEILRDHEFQHLVDTEPVVAVARFDAILRTLQGRKAI
jgi:hypothetical protein